MSPTRNSRVDLAISAMRDTPTLSRRRAARIYGCTTNTIRNRMLGVPARGSKPTKQQNLLPGEESALVAHILRLDEQGFAPRKDQIKQAASDILAKRGKEPVGTNWTCNFIKRHPELRSRRARTFDYKRHKAEDPDAIRAWFETYKSNRDKYGIVEDDIYNFDETGFGMGMLSPNTMVVTSSDRSAKPRVIQPGSRIWTTVIATVSATGWALPPYILFRGKQPQHGWGHLGVPGDWVLHPSDRGWTTDLIGMRWLEFFEKSTRTRTKGSHRLLVLDGHASHLAQPFNNYCHDHNIIPICMPPHASHILQPLDVGCFGPLKHAYHTELDKISRDGVKHIDFADFLVLFKPAFHSAMSPSNIMGAFRGSGLVPYNPAKIIDKLPLISRLQRPSTPPEGQLLASYDPHTPTTIAESAAHTKYLQDKVRAHQDSSPTAIIELLDYQKKGFERIAADMAILQANTASMTSAIMAKAKRRSMPKTRVTTAGPITIADLAKERPDIASSMQNIEDEIDIHNQLIQMGAEIDYGLPLIDEEDAV
jgi:hypothetical protein